MVAAARLLDALQTGVDLRVSPRIRTAAFLEGRAGARTEPAPPVALRQLDPGTGGYKAEDANGNEIGWVFVPVAAVDEVWDVAAFPNVWWLRAPTAKPPGPGNAHVRFTGAAGAFPQLGGSAKVYKGVKHGASGNPIAGQVVFMVLPTGSWPEEPDWYVRNSTTLTNNVIKLGSGESIRFAKLGGPPTGQVIKGT
ncbi:MAG: hypothetical protein GY913_07895 [Proteobacteria bacterium]|nr:hypothetical protein [Pseudomonadota bacterium]MCP4916834.1 hypothetical protein [Pseudomonadota bacterium]